MVEWFYIITETLFYPVGYEKILLPSISSTENETQKRAGYSVNINPPIRTYLLFIGVLQGGQVCNKSSGLLRHHDLGYATLSVCSCEGNVDIALHTT